MLDELRPVAPLVTGDIEHWWFLREEGMECTWWLLLDELGEPLGLEPNRLLSVAALL